MSMFNRIKVSLIAICLLVTILGFASTVQADRATSGARETKSDQTIVLTASRADMEAASKMWDKQALLDAKAMPLPEYVEPAAPAEETAVISEPGMVEGAAPSPEADAVAMAQFPDEWKALTYDSDVPLMEEPYGTANVYTGYWSNYFTYFHKYFPFKAIGKLYFTTPSGTSYCTASVISGNDIIVTAAHCVYDTVANQFYTGWMFYPAYRNGVAPYGGYTWSQARVLTNWVNATGTVQRYDVALIKLVSDVSYYTGYLGRAWDGSYVRNMTTFGYPSNLSIGTLYTWQCHAESFSSSTDVIGMGCNMTYGSSGGPWIYKFYPWAAGSNNYVNSVVSGGNPAYPTFYGARFSSSNIVVLCNAQGC